jgi:hypothetical protein
MGFDPMEIKFLRLAHDLGLGCADVRDIEIVGDRDAANENWHFDGPFKKLTFAARQQHRIYWGPLKKPIEWSLKTWLAPWAYLASVTYHDMFWYPVYGKPRVQQALQSEWGRLFANWGNVPTDAAGKGYPNVGMASPDLVRIGLKHFAEGARLMGMRIESARPPVRGEQVVAALPQPRRRTTQSNARVPWPPPPRVVPSNRERETTRSW